MAEAGSRSLRDRVSALTRSEVVLVCVFTVFAAVLRLWRLGTAPLGLHGDEAWTGLDAQRVLDEGWLGPYLISALGQPIGPVYWTAAVFAVLPDTTFVLRVSMAVFGIATIPLSYVTFRLMFDRTVAVFAAFLLAVMMWHLHLSRTAFMVQVAPFFELAVLCTLFLGLRRNNILLVGMSGVLAGLGVYTYNSYILFLPVPLVAIAWTYWRSTHDGNRIGLGIIAVSLFVTSAIIAAIPMIQYINDNTFDWRIHQKVVNITDQPVWEDASIADKAELLVDRAWEWQKGLVFGGRSDLGDGLATDNHPPVEPVVYALALVGLGMAFWRWKKPEYAVLIAACVLLPWGAILTIQDGLFRRTLGLAPFIAVLAAIPLAALWRMAIDRRFALWPALAFLVLLVPAFVAVKTTWQYFVPVQDSFAVRYVFPFEMDAASRHMATLPDGRIVYFYSDRWRASYETRRFLAPNVVAIDRSFEFGPETEDLDLSADGSRDVTFVFLGRYLDVADTVIESHPGAVETISIRDGEVLFRAVDVPAD